MKTSTLTRAQRTSISGRISLMFMWLLGVPLPILLLVWMFRG